MSLNIEDASIETSGDVEDDEDVFDDVCFYKPFISCRCNKLFFDSCTTYKLSDRKLDRLIKR